MTPQPDTETWHLLNSDRRDQPFAGTAHDCLIPKKGV
jgi:hypothetical protein